LWSFLHNKAYSKQLNGAEMNARQQRHVGALGSTLWVRGSPRAHPRDHPGSPRLTSAAPDGGERRRPMLTRQNRKGNIEASSSEFCPCPPLSYVGLYFRTVQLPLGTELPEIRWRSFLPLPAFLPWHLFLSCHHLFLQPLLLYHISRATISFGRDTQCN
jgi:hypothetical protein